MRNIQYFAIPKRHPLSNFWKCQVTFEGLTYGNTEAIFQSRKTLDTSRYADYAKMSPSMSKAEGRKENLRPDWDKVKFDIMYEVLEAKFDQVPEFRKALMDTGDAIIIEDTTGWHDNIWGCCSCPRCINKPYSNYLGLALTLLREHKRREGYTG